MDLDEGTVGRRGNFGPLYELLVDRFPEHRTQNGRFDIPTLAEDLSVSSETVYRALRNNRVSATLAKNLIKLSVEMFALDEHEAEELTGEDMLPFLDL